MKLCGSIKNVFEKIKLTLTEFLVEIFLKVRDLEFRALSMFLVAQEVQEFRQLEFTMAYHWWRLLLS